MPPRTPPPAAPAPGPWQSAGQWQFSGQPPPQGAPPYGQWPPAGGSPAPGWYPYYGPTSYGPSSTLPYFDPDTGMPLSHWWKRLVAWLIDTAVVDAVVYVLYFVVLVPLIVTTVPSNQNNNQQSANVAPFLGGFALFMALLFVGISLYFGILDGMFRGQTLGKLALGISTRDSRDGRLIGFWRAWGRYWFNFVLSVPCYVLFIIGNCAPLWDRRRQSWADHVVRSMVIDVRG